MSKNYKFIPNLAEAVKQKQRILFGERYVGVSLSQIRAPEWAQVAISNFIDKPNGFLVYCGNPGIGKTFLCSALIEFAMTRFESFRYWDESQLLQRVRSSMGEKGGDYLKTLGYLIDDPFVMLDDIGSCGLNDWRKEVIFDAIDERYRSTLPTVITSNFSKKEFEQNFHPRLSSRLFDKQNTIIEILDGVDHRR